MCKNRPHLAARRVQILFRLGRWRKHVVEERPEFWGKTAVSKYVILSYMGDWQAVVKHWRFWWYYMLSLIHSPRMWRFEWCRVWNFRVRHACLLMAGRRSWNYSHNRTDIVFVETYKTLAIETYSAVANNYYDISLGSSLATFADQLDHVIRSTWLPNQIVNTSRCHYRGRWTLLDINYR